MDSGDTFTFANGVDRIVDLGTSESFSIRGPEGSNIACQYMGSSAPTNGLATDQGFFAVQQACPHCHGRGTLIKDPCTKCHGHGRVEKTKTLSVKIPAGVDEGDRIRLSGEGEHGINGGPSGDLYVQIHLKPHSHNQREGNDLHCEMPISFTTAALGGEIEIPTLDTVAKIKIPPETQSGRTFRLRGKGIKGVRSHAHGDLLCHVVVETPVDLTERQKELLRELEECSLAEDGKHNPRAKSWMDRVREFFAAS